MGQIESFLRRHAGRSAVIAGLVAGGAVVFWVIRAGVGPSEAAAIAGRRTYVCSETGKAFVHTLVAGESSPVTSPYTRRPTGYLAEWCYWTADGRPKSEPTPVLLNLYRDGSGPTFCPDCGRLVVAHNPRPRDGDAAPPTREAYAAARGGNAVVVSHVTR